MASLLIEREKLDYAEFDAFMSGRDLPEPHHEEPAEEELEEEAEAEAGEAFCEAADAEAVSPEGEE